MKDDAIPKFGFAAKDLIDKGDVSKQDVEDVKSWLASQNLPKLSEEQVVIFLLSCINNCEAAKATITAYYSIKSEAPQLFDNRNMASIAVQKQLVATNICLLPERTEDGCAIIWVSFHDDNYKSIDLETIIKILYMCIDLALHDYPPTGLIFIIELHMMGLMHLTKLRRGLLRIFFRFLHDALPVRLRAIHIFSGSFIINKLFMIIRPLMEKEIMEVVNFHTKSSDMELFYKTVVPRKCLPKELGGDCFPIRVLNEQCAQRLAAIQDHFDSEELQRKSGAK